ncbi:MAG: beta-lactamase family protein [Lachnospiraceae bacterium]|nr:beta-lactamase family protein [Lachnospiraceae bacterium]
MSFDKLTEYLDSLQDTYGMPVGDLMVMKDHEEVYRHSFGYADYDKQVPVSANNLYRLYSATKVITMTAILQLIEQGKLKFHDRVSDYLPEYDKVFVKSRLPENKDVTHIAHNDMRIIDLMTMSAGFSYDLFDPALQEKIKETNDKGSTREMIEALSRVPLLFEPGTEWNYSLSHDVAAAVLEVVTGMSFGEYLKKYIFEPLGANDFYFQRHIDKATHDRICAIYTADNDRPPFYGISDEKADEFTFTQNYESGGAGLIGSVDSYILVVDALACGGVGKTGKRILKPETVELFTHPYTTFGQLKKDFDSLNRIGYEYGLGVRVLVDGTKSKSPVGEFGWDGAAGAYALVDTKNKISVFYAEHVTCFGDNYHVIHPKIRDLIYEGLE